MFTITPIGSCRIATPLRHGQAAHGIRLNLTRCYGYCHSPAEAVQMARFFRDEIAIDPEIWPLVSRSHHHATLAGQTHEPSDFYVVELASAKELTVDGMCIQLNYLRSVFQDFFADHQRTAAFWEHAQAGDPAKTAAFLRSAWSATETQKAESAFLARIKLDLVTRGSLRENIRTLAQLLPDVMFVSHVDARKPDGSPIKSRAAFIRLVEDEVSAAGLKFYDPTELMAEFGQPAAIEDHSTSLAHFTTAFSTAVMDDWMTRFIAPKTDAVVADETMATDAFRAQIEAACSAGHYASATARLAPFADTTADIQTLLNEVCRDQKSAQTAFVENVTAALNSTPSKADHVKRIDKAGALGLFDLSQTLASYALGDLNDVPCHVLTNVALRASAKGEFDSAFVFALAAFRQNSGSQRAARLLADLVITQNRDLAEMSEPEHLAQIQTLFISDDLVQALNRPDAPLTTLISPDISAADLARIAATLAQTGGIRTAARVVSHWRGLQKHARLRDAGLIALLDGWIAQAKGLHAPLEIVQSLSAIQTADPRHAGVRSALRDAKVDLVSRMRSAGKARDLKGLLALSPEVEALAMPLPEYDLWCARVLFDGGDYNQAIDYASTAARALPAKISVWVLLMRAGIKTGQMDLVETAADQVIVLAADTTPKLKAEAERAKLRQQLEA